MTTARDVPICFVGGVPRAGTTVTHALLCTSRKTNNYRGEISYVKPLVEAYTTGLKRWERHTSFYFAEKNDFRLHIRKLLNQTFDHICTGLGTPDILCLKDPLLTPFFPRLRQLLGARARFMTVVRNPYDVVRSRQQVAYRGKRVFDADVVRSVSEEYMKFYQHLENPKMEDSLMHIRYEDLLEEETLEALQKFIGCDDISVDRTWQEISGEGSSVGPDGEILRASDMKADTSVLTIKPAPWGSPKYNQPIDLTNRLTPLKPKYRAVVNDVCGAFMDTHGYTQD